MDDARKPLRLWPGVIAALVLCLFRFSIPGLVGALVIVLWWLFFSRAPWAERLGVIAFAALAIAATRLLVDVSIRTGMMGFMQPVFATFFVTPALVAGAVIARGRSDSFRRAAIAVCILLACSALLFLRTAGITGGGGAELAWRWSQTPEQRLLAQTANEPAPVPPPAAVVEPAMPAPVAAVVPKRDAEWPGFRGKNRDGVVRGVSVDTDWSKRPPVELWHRAIGPGWSSFAVSGNLLYTQEQRGEEEIVGCYRVTTGEPVWRHSDKVRFWESNGGAGPRGTPTLSNGRVYAFGGTGLLNALDAGTGAVIWTRNVATDAQKQVPMWGFASSPLVIGDVVIVAASGKLAAYEIASGKPRWFGPPRPSSYSSPHRYVNDGIEQVVLLTAAGAISVSPSDGALLWEHEWDAGGSTITQPAITADGDLLINSIAATGGNGVRRLSIAHASLDGARDRAGKFSVTERWTSTGLKPYFNDFVVHKGHAYGFDGNILACIDLADGKRTWKGGRYGGGQLVLLADSDALLVISEDGELALVSATPEEFKELGRIAALEGKTWNHPVIVNDILLIRNGEEMAAFRLPRLDR